jgi:hypothetical protein
MAQNEFAAAPTTRHIDVTDQLSPWLFPLSAGLTEQFDYSRLRSSAAATAFILTLPYSDRVRAARGLYDHRKEIGHEAVYAGIMTAWDHDHRDIVEAFGSVARFTAALRDVAPRLSHSDQLTIWRGALLNRSQPIADAIHISWTRSRNVACWFALRNYVPAIQPFQIPVVLRTRLEHDVVISRHNARAEQEVLIDPHCLAACTIVVEGLDARFMMRTPLVDVTSDESTYSQLIVAWRRFAQRYQHWKTLFESHRICTHTVMTAHRH